MTDFNTPNTPKITPPTPKPAQNQKTAQDKSDISPVSMAKDIKMYDDYEKNIIKNGQKRDITKRAYNEYKSKIERVAYYDNHSFTTNKQNYTFQGNGKQRKG